MMKTTDKNVVVLLCFLYFNWRLLLDISEIDTGLIAGMALPQHDVSQISLLLESITEAYTTLGKGILALHQLNKVSELLWTVICSLNGEHDKYEDLLKEFSRLETQYKKLVVEIEFHIKTVKEQAQMNTKIVEEAKRQMLNGNNIPNYFVDIEATVKELHTSSEEFREKYFDVLHEVKNCCIKAKALYDGNEHKPDLFKKGAIVGFFGGAGVGIFTEWQIAKEILCVFVGISGAIVGGCFGYVVGWMAGGLRKSKNLNETIIQIDKVLWENFGILTEICRLLDKLKKTANSLADGREDTPHTQDEVEGSVGTQNSDTGTSSDDDKDIDFLIGLRFDSFKKASEDLEKNCDYLLANMPLKMLELLSANEKCNKNSTDKEKLN